VKKASCPFAAGHRLPAPRDLCLFSTLPAFPGPERSACLSLDRPCFLLFAWPLCCRSGARSAGAWQCLSPIDLPAIPQMNRHQRCCCRCSWYRSLAKKRSRAQTPPMLTLTLCPARSCDSVQAGVVGGCVLGDLWSGFCASKQPLSSNCGVYMVHPDDAAEVDLAVSPHQDPA